MNKFKLIPVLCLGFAMSAWAGEEAAEIERPSMYVSQSGIVTAVGTITSVEERGDLRARIACPYDPAKIAIGASISCSVPMR